MSKSEEESLRNMIKAYSDLDDKVAQAKAEGILQGMAIMKQQKEDK